MKITNYVKIILPALRGNEGFARSAVAAFCTPLSPTVEQINDVRTAVSEAVTNVIVHAYPNRDEGEIRIDAMIYDDGVLHVKIEDDGIGLENIEEMKKPFFTTKSTEEHSGMGFTIMEAFMDKLEIFSEIGRGTRVVLQKKLGKNA